MQSVTYTRFSSVESILIDVFKPNTKIGQKILQGDFQGKSLSQSLLYLKELGELSEDILFQTIEQIHNYHLENYHRLQSSINSYCQEKI